VAYKGPPGAQPAEREIMCIRPGITGSASIVRRFTLVVLLLVSACGPSIHIRKHHAFASLDPDCCPLMVERDEALPPQMLLVAEVGYGENGLSNRCTYPEIRERLRVQACTQGADVVKIVAESHPNFASTCYRVKAALYRLGAPTTSGQGSTAIDDAERARCSTHKRRFRP
jgi:hypothetical protein